MKSYISKFLNDYRLGNILIAFLFFYIFNSLLIKVFNFFYIADLILPTLAILKLLFFLFFLIILTVNFKTVKKLFIYLGLLFVIYIAGNFNWDGSATSVLNSYKYFKTANFFYLIKYLYPFVFLGVFSLIKNKQEITNRYFKIIETVLIVNVFFIFLGVLFSIDFFQSYIHSGRFGYTGIFETLFFVYLSMIVVSRRVFLNKIDSKIIFIAIASLFSGTKIIVLFFMLLLLFYLYEKRKNKMLLLYCGVLVSVIVFIKPVIHFFIKIFPFWDVVLNRFGYIGLLSSTRDINIKNSIEYFNINGSLKNLFVGGLEFTKCGVEMDFIDLFSFFGLIGVTVYLLLLNKIINKSYHLIPLITAFFGGDFLLNIFLISVYFIWVYESYPENKIFE